MEKLILENVRCFHGHHELPLAPLTLLIGENSTGKSTVLAAARIAKDICCRVDEPDFNEEPFDWGAYDQIVYTRNRFGGRAQSFAIGYESSDIPGYDCTPVRVTVTFEQKNAQPKLCEWRIVGSRDSVVIKSTAGGNAIVTAMAAGRKTRHSFKWNPEFINVYDVLLATFGKSVTLGKMRGAFPICFAFFDYNSDQPDAYAFAPIRTRPRRTYDRRIDIPHPEGEHVPMVLVRLKTSDPKKWEELKTELIEFGRECGLYKTVNVKSLDKNSGPFQVQITVDRSPTNLIDVGYGVSQALPLLVDCLEEENRLLLIQQPEVHLHPRAQAQLGSFLAYLAGKRQKRFIVETHSDYLVDRVRRDVRDGKHGLRPEDVSILYFERKDTAVSVHAMRIDECGNLLDAPPGYRQFFLEEETRFIGG